MNTQKYIYSLLTVATLVGSVATPVFALTANISASLGATTSVGTSSSAHATLKAEVQAKRMSLITTRGDKEIDRRIDALNKLIVRIGEMKRVSDSEKTSISTEIQSQITALAVLKTKIDADTDIAVLRVDVKSITDSYRIFALIMPRNTILAAADRLNAIVVEMNAVGVKLQARVATAQSAGKDVTALTAALNDFTTKLTDAKIQSESAASGVASLTPDQGDKTKAAANRAALVAARGDIKTGTEDLKAARADVKKIIEALKAFNLEVKANATSTATTTGQ